MLSAPWSAIWPESDKPLLLSVDARILYGTMSGIISCGVDIIEISRVRRLFERHEERFLRRVYGPWERTRAMERPDPGTFLAGRFAAKEAILKVLGCGLFSGIRLSEIEVSARDTGEPTCVLSGHALDRETTKG